MSLKKKFATEPINTGDFYTEYKQRILYWALGLTKSQSYAEELTHDALTQFVLNKQDINKINNPDGYLRRMIRYMYLNRIKEAARLQNVLDSDSMSDGLFSFELSDQERAKQARKDLVKICRYACIRKETSRIGSTLILRYFYKYSVSDVALLIRRPRYAVDNGIRKARKEADLFLKNPSSFKIFTRKKIEVPEFKDSLDDTDVLAQIIEFIAMCRNGRCLTNKKLKELYKNNNKNAIPSTVLSHIVSCMNCLGSISEILGLPTISDLNATPHHINRNDHKPLKEMKEKSDKRDDDDDICGPGFGGSGNESILAACRKQINQIKDHRPDELRVYVDHVLINSLPINNERTVVNILTPFHQGEFLHISSDREVMLLLIDISYGESKIIERRLDLSDERFLEVNYDRETGWLYLCYVDPLVPFNEYVEVRFKGKELIYEKIERLIIATKANLFSLKASLVAPKNKSSEQNLEIEDVKLFTRFQKKRSVFDNRGVMSFVLTSFLIAISAFLCVFVYQLTHKVSAMEILNRATATENAKKAENIRASRGVFRKVTIDEISPNGDDILSSHTVEFEQIPTLETKKLYRDGKEPIATEFITSDGKRTLSRRRDNIKSEAYEPITIGNVWRFEFSAEKFKSLIISGSLNIIQDNDTYVLSSKVSSNEMGLNILDASITLQKDGLHPIEQRLVIKENENSRPRVFVFKEKILKYLNARSMSSQTIITDPYQVIISDESLSSSNTVSVRSDEISEELHLVKLHKSDLPNLRIEILSKLSEKNISGVDVTIHSNGYVLIESFLDLNQNKELLQKKLSFISSHPAVRFNLKSENEVIAKIETFPLPNENINATSIMYGIQDYQILDDYFSAEHKTKSDEEIQQLIDQYIKNLAAYSKTLLNNANQLRRIAGGFSNEQLHTLTYKNRVRWIQLVSQELHQYKVSLSKLESHLAPVFFKNNANPIISDESLSDIKDAETLNHIADRIVKTSAEIFKDSKSAFVKDIKSAILSGTSREIRNRSGILKENFADAKQLLMSLENVSH